MLFFRTETVAKMFHFHCLYCTWEFSEKLEEDVRKGIGKRQRWWRKSMTVSIYKSMRSKNQGVCKKTSKESTKLLMNEPVVRMSRDTSKYRAKQRHRHRNVNMWPRGREGKCELIWEISTDIHTQTASGDAAAWHRELSSVLWVVDEPGGMGVGGRSKMEMYMYTQSWFTF